MTCQYFCVIVNSLVFSTVPKYPKFYLKKYVKMFAQLN